MWEIAKLYIVRRRIKYAARTIHHCLAQLPRHERRQTIREIAKGRYGFLEVVE